MFLKNFENKGCRNLRWLGVVSNNHILQNMMKKKN